MALNEKQIRFCEEYLVDLNGAQAAIRAGYSEKTARAISAENLTKPDIQNYLTERRKQIASDLSISQQRVLKEYASIAFTDIRKYYDESGNLKAIPDLDDESAAALAGVDVDELFDFKDGEKVKIGITKKIKRWDKTKALDSLGRHLGLFEKDNAQIKQEIFPPFNDSQLDKLISALRKK